MKILTLLVVCLLCASPVMASNCGGKTPQQAHKDEQNASILNNSYNISEEGRREGFKKAYDDVNNVFTDCTFKIIQDLQGTWDKLKSFSSLLNESTFSQIGKDVLEQAVKKALKNTCDALKERLRNSHLNYGQDIGQYFNSYSTVGGLSRAANAQTSSIIDSMFKSLSLP